MKRGLIVWAFVAASASACRNPNEADRSTSLEVACDADTLNGPGRQTQCKATVTLSSGIMQDQTAAAQWSSSNPTVATVSSRGLVTSGQPGTAVIAAKFGGVSGSKSFAVFAPPPQP